MIRSAYFAVIVFLLVAVGVTNYFAYQFFWYWRFWWFDIVMHTLGGFIVGSATLWWFYLRKPISVQIELWKPAFFRAFAAISVIGAGWELFEFGKVRFIFLPIHDAGNTASDLFFDGVGCALAVILFMMLYNIFIKASLNETN